MLAVVFTLSYSVMVTWPHAHGCGGQAVAEGASKQQSPDLACEFLQVSGRRLLL